MWWGEEEEAEGAFTPSTRFPQRLQRTTPAYPRLVTHSLLDLREDID